MFSLISAKIFNNDIYIRVCHVCTLIPMNFVLYLSLHTIPINFSTLSHFYFYTHVLCIYIKCMFNSHTKHVMHVFLSLF